MRCTWNVHSNLMNGENRKFVKSICYQSHDEMDTAIIVGCPLEAYRIRKARIYRLAILFLMDTKSRSNFSSFAKSSMLLASLFALEGS